MLSDESEARRLLALDDLEILDTAPEERFDRITRMAAQVLDAPNAMITLVDRDRQWAKSFAGPPEGRVPEVPREQSFCRFTLVDDRPLVVPDARVDERFADNPLVTGPPGIVFYAGAPIHARDGSPVGALCVTDSTPRELTPEQREVLEQLAHWVDLELGMQREREELARMQRRFVGIASHELRTPLTTLKGQVEELLDPLDDDEEHRREATEAIDRSTARLVDLVEDVLLGSRAETADTALAPEQFNLTELVRDVLHELGERAEGVVQHGDEPVRIVADRRRVRTAVRGLLRDVLEPRGGTVALTVRREADTALLVLEAPVAPAGVGLAIARAVVVLHKGRLDVRHGPQSCGATLALPVAGPSTDDLDS